MKKSISILFAICVLNASFVSCKSSSLLSIDEASTKSVEEESLILHTPTKVFSVDNFNFTDDKLLGDLKKKRKHKGFTIHVYSNLEYSFSLKENEIKNLDLSNSRIQKITYTKKTPGKGIVIGVGSTAAVLLIAVFIRVTTMAWN